MLLNFGNMTLDHLELIKIFMQFICNLCNLEPYTKDCGLRVRDIYVAKFISIFMSLNLID
jgi:hypothetical protein